MEHAEHRRTTVALVGLGAAARNIHGPAIRKLSSRLALVAGCDPSEEARRRFARQFAAVPLFESAEQMFEHATPEATIVTSPPDQHHQAVVQSLRARCHVFCEKPFATSLAEADAMIDEARKAERYLAVNHEFREMPIFRESMSTIGSEAFGRLLFVHAWQTFRPTKLTEAGWRGSARRRLCLDFGVHVLDLMRYFFDDEPSRVYAHMPNPFGAEKSDVVNTIVLDFDDGRAATIVLDRLSRGPEHYLEMRLDGEQAAIHASIGGQLRMEGGLRTHDRRPFARLHVAGGGTAHLQQGDRSRLLARAPINPFVPATAALLERFVDTIERGETSQSDALSARASLALALAAYESAETGVPVTMDGFIESSRSAHA
ncbi:MAG: Gfo/Idh/MocA family oxidoreductase [Acidobacteriota bacterium]